MFRHRKRLIAKRLSKLMRKRNEKYMKELFAKFIQSRSQQMQQIIPSHEEQLIEEIEEEISSEEIIEQQGTQEMSLTDYVSSLSPQQKLMFKRENPELPETFFMSKKQKEKFFNRKNNKFQNDLKHTPTRKSKTTNHVEFEEKFVYKPFYKEDKVTEIRRAKEFNSPYNKKIHFS